MSNAKLEKLISYKFKNIDYLNQALTHSSFSIKKIKNYERLEFLGDRVLGVIIAEEIFSKMPDAKVGQMHLKFESLTNEFYLSKISLSIGIPDFINIQSGTYGNKLNNNKSILADVLEAIFGAILLDGGFYKVRKVILNLIDFDSEQIIINSKSRLQEFLLSKGEDLPIYKLLNSKGPDHAPFFKIKVNTKSNQWSIGEGGSIKIAEQKAAENLLKKLNNKL